MKKEKTSHWGRSLKVLSWEENPMTKSQELISATVHEWYEAKHRISSREEKELINSIEINICPYCKSERIVKRGKDKGIQ